MKYLSPENYLDNGVFKSRQGESFQPSEVLFSLAFYLSPLLLPLKVDLSDSLHFSFYAPFIALFYIHNIPQVLGYFFCEPSYCSDNVCNCIDIIILSPKVFMNSSALA